MKRPLSCSEAPGTPPCSEGHTVARGTGMAGSAAAPEPPTVPSTIMPSTPPAPCMGAAALFCCSAPEGAMASGAAAGGFFGRPALYSASACRAAALVPPALLPLYTPAAIDRPSCACTSLLPSAAAMARRIWARMALPLLAGSCSISSTSFIHSSSSYSSAGYPWLNPRDACRWLMYGAAADLLVAASRTTSGGWVRRAKCASMPIWAWSFPI
mmetsp:Transcript_60731/g.192741  ORF Transcript_60731/g.192741 Transcript_60731/m.192741 type:complete len:213 (-) Transcript_60731:267-905(-)